MSGLVSRCATRVIATSVVRDRYSGREMAEVMSLTFMVFMAMAMVYIFPQTVFWLPELIYGLR